MGAELQSHKESTRNTAAAIPVQSGFLQRKCGCGQHTVAGGQCEGCSKKHLSLQRAASSSLEGETRNSSDVPEIVREVLRLPGHPLEPASRAFFEPRFGHDFSRVRLRTDAQAAESAQAVNARAFTVGENIVFDSGQYSPGTRTGELLLAHELTHVIQQGRAASGMPLTMSAASDESETQARQTSVDVVGSGQSREISGHSSGPVLQRDLAQQPPPQVPTQPQLTSAQIQRALRYNRASYNEESTRLIQNIVGGPITGRFEQTTVELVALIQQEYGLVPADGKVGPDTYDFLIRELQAENVNPGDCLTLFQVVGPKPLDFFRQSSTQGTIASFFEVHARFDPRCKCEDFEYRQFIRGHVELIENAIPNVTPPTPTGCETLISANASQWVWNMDGCFGIPGGLRPTWAEDGDVAVATGLAGRRYGHRSAQPNPADGRDQYLPNRATGCIYKAFDEPDLNPVPAGPGDTGDTYSWEMDFLGRIQRAGGTVVSEEKWRIDDAVII